MATIGAGISDCDAEIVLAQGRGRHSAGLLLELSIIDDFSTVPDPRDDPLDHLWRQRMAASNFANKFVLLQLGVRHRRDVGMGLGMHHQTVAWFRVFGRARGEQFVAVQKVLGHPERIRMVLVCRMSASTLSAGSISIAKPLARFAP